MVELASQPAPSSPLEVTKETPVLWHLKISHYNEKVRWALDYKGVPHVRRTAMPGAHAKVAERLWGGRTFPVVDFGDQVVGDSASVIAAIERRWSENSLYPDKPETFTEALELEEFFDEELGPYTRLLAVQRLLREPQMMLGAFTPEMRGWRRSAATALFPLLRRRVRRDLRINDASAQEAWTKCETACRRFAPTFRQGQYLVGDQFSVADLTLASLLAPIVAPEQYPYPQPQRKHPSFSDLRRLLDRYGALDWTLRTYARHRPPSAEVPAP